MTGRTRLLNGRTVIVLGASRGIGRGVAIELGREGAHVVAVARSRGDDRFGGSIDATVAQIRGTGGLASSATCDLADPREIDLLLERVLREHRNLDSIINCAVRFSYEPLSGLDADEWDATFDVNVRGPYLLTRAAVNAMARTGGHIIHFTGSGAQHASQASIATGASKAALERFVAGAANELRSSAVGLSLFDPGMVKTERAAILRPETDWTGVPGPADVAAAVVSVIRRDPVEVNGRKFSYDRPHGSHPTSILLI